MAREGARIEPAKEEKRAVLRKGCGARGSSIAINYIDVVFRFSPFLIVGTLPLCGCGGGKAKVVPQPAGHYARFDRPQAAKNISSINSARNGTKMRL